MFQNPHASLCFEQLFIAWASPSALLSQAWGFLLLPLPAVLSLPPGDAPHRCSAASPRQPSLSPRKRDGGRVRGPCGHCPAWANTTGIFCTAVLHPGRHSAAKQRQVPGRPSPSAANTDQHKIPDVPASRDVLSESAALTTAFTDLISEGLFINMCVSSLMQFMSAFFML